MGGGAGGEGGGVGGGGGAGGGGVGGVGVGGGVGDGGGSGDGGGGGGSGGSGGGKGQKKLAMAPMFHLVAMSPCSCAICPSSSTVRHTVHCCSCPDIIPPHPGIPLKIKL